MKILQISGILLAVAVLITGSGYLLRSDPIGPISGLTLSGEEAAYPAHWESCNKNATVAVETRPENPYSVTTWCVVYANDLFIPASNGSTKTWPKLITENPNIRIKISDSLYSVKATRVPDFPLEVLGELIMKKYPESAEQIMANRDVQDTWVFRISPR